jgi:hypothetical protein
MICKGGSKNSKKNYLLKSCYKQSCNNSGNVNARVKTERGNIDNSTNASGCQGIPTIRFHVLTLCFVSVGYSAGVQISYNNSHLR